MRTRNWLGWGLLALLAAAGCKAADPWRNVDNSRNEAVVAAENAGDVYPNRD